MRTHILCGSQEIQVEVPDSAVVIRPNSVPAPPNPIAYVQESIDNPIGSAPLAKLAQDRRNACVVISDITRPVPNKIILPPILDALESAGIERQNIIILIATGMHRPNQGKELESMVGADIMANYRIENHYCLKGDDLRKIAEVDGADIELNNYYLDADLKILTGLIEPHMYAGYSGGRKSLLPGISSFKTMSIPNWSARDVQQRTSSPIAVNRKTSKSTSGASRRHTKPWPRQPMFTFILPI